MVSKRERYLVLVLACAIMILTSAIASAFMKEVRAQEAPKTKLQFEPSDITVGVLGVDLPTPVTTINVTVSNVTDLFNWQIKVYFDQSIIRFEDQPAIYPASNINIFRGLSHFFYNYTGTDAGGRYVLIAATLIPKVLSDGSTVYPSVNGSGVLTQLQFRGVSSGVSYLNFSRPYGGDTLLWNTTVDPTTNIPIPADVFDAKVTVLGNGISLSIQPETMEIGNTTNITGLIYPRQETQVKISYMRNGTDTDWKQLATVQTVRIDVNATYYVTGYNYTWKPGQEGLYYVKAEGGGFVSQEKTLSVNPSNKPAPPNLWLLYGPPAAFGGVLVGGFFLWDRRRRHSNRMILP